MRLAYHIAFHNKPYQARWLADAVLADDDRYLVHVDAKSADEVFAAAKRMFADHPNVTFQKRHSIIYSEWQMCQIEIDAIRHFVETADDWDYFINFSGSCYPLWPMEVIKARLAETPGRNYVKCTPMAELPRYFRRRKNFYSFRLGERLVRTPIPLRPPPGIRADWHGSAWHILTRPFCEWVLSDPVAHRIMEFHRHTKMPMEMLFQTLIQNSPFVETVHGHMRNILWRPHSPHPITLTSAHLPMLLESQAFIARKFDAKVDENVLIALRDRQSASRPSLKHNWHEGHANTHSSDIEAAMNSH